MELGHSMEERMGVMEFVKALWDAAKWKQIIAMGLALVLMTVPQMLNSSFTGRHRSGYYARRNNDFFQLSHRFCDLLHDGFVRHDSPW